MSVLTTFSTSLLFWTIIATSAGTNTNMASVMGTQADPVTGKTLYAATLSGDVAEVKQLTEDQCSGVNWQMPEDGMASLHVAAAKNHAQIVMLLLSCNADPNIQEATGTTPLMATSSIDVVQALLTANPDIDIQDEDGLSALMMSISDNQIEITKALLKAGADPDLQYSDGQTALMLAVRMNRLEHVKTLLQQGADATIISKVGYTAAYIAETAGYMDILQLIEEHTSATQKHTPSMLVICIAVVVFIVHTCDLHDWWMW